MKKILYTILILFCASFVNAYDVQIIGSDGVADGIKIDSSTSTISTTSYEHHEIHAGSSFTTCDVQNVDTTTLKWMVTTPNTTKYAHMIFDFQCTGELLITITEGADRVGTNDLAEVNRRRVGTPTAATAAIHRAYTGGTTDGATTIEKKRIGATGVGSKTVSAGGNRGQNEFILKPNTKYIISAQTFANVYVTACFDWYEHTDN